MKIKFDLGNGPHEVDNVGLGDMVAFERHFELPSTVMEPETEIVTDRNGNRIQDVDENGVLLFKDGEPVWKVRVVGEQRIEWLAFMVWRSARRQGFIPAAAPFDDAFLDSIVDFSIEAESGDNESGEATAAITA